MFRSIFDFLDRNIGRCPKCMGQAFLVAIAASAVTAAAVLFGLPYWLTVVALIVVAASLLLWLCHIVAYALRTTLSAKNAETNEVQGEVGLSRRAFAATFAKSAAYAIVTTAFVTVSASAQGRCNCSQCRPEQSCCPTANGYCGCFPFRCP